MTDFDALLATLAQHDVAFILVGGAAAIAHGSARLTQDLDIVYERSPANLDRLVAALAEHKPYLRGDALSLPQPGSAHSREASCGPSQGSGSVGGVGSDRRRGRDLKLSRGYGGVILDASTMLRGVRP